MTNIRYVCILIFWRSPAAQSLSYRPAGRSHHFHPRHTFAIDFDNIARVKKNLSSWSQKKNLKAHRSFPLGVPLGYIHWPKWGDINCQQEFLKMSHHTTLPMQLKRSVKNHICYPIQSWGVDEGRLDIYEDNSKFCSPTSKGGVVICIMG